MLLINIKTVCTGLLYLSATPQPLMLCSLKDQRSWEVVTRWHLDIMLSDALSTSSHPPSSSPPLPSFLLPCLPHFLPPLCAKYTSDVRVFYFYWMRAVCNAFTSVPASC